MGGVQKRKSSNAKNKNFHRVHKTKHYLRDHDQIHADLKQNDKFKVLPIDEDKPGSGQFYCISCARYFDSLSTLSTHKTTKKHKRMLKKMNEQPYTHQQAYEAGK